MRIRTTQVLIFIAIGSPTSGEKKTRGWKVLRYLTYSTCRKARPMTFIRGFPSVPLLELEVWSAPRRAVFEFTSQQPKSVQQLLQVRGWYLATRNSFPCLKWSFIYGESIVNKRCIPRETSWVEVNLNVNVKIVLLTRRWHMPSRSFDRRQRLIGPSTLRVHDGYVYATPWPKLFSHFSWG